MLKILSDVAMLLVMSAIPYVLGTSRLRGARAKEVLYETAKLNPAFKN